MTELQQREALAKKQGWYRLNGAWIHPEGYAKPLPPIDTLRGYVAKANLS